MLSPDSHGLVQVQRVLPRSRTSTRRSTALMTGVRLPRDDGAQDGASASIPWNAITTIWSASARAAIILPKRFHDEPPRCQARMVMSANWPRCWHEYYKARGWVNGVLPEPS